MPLTDYLGLGVVLFSYARTLCWGFTADRDLVPDLAEFVAGIAASFAALREAAAGAPLEVVAPARAERRAHTLGNRAGTV